MTTAPRTPPRFVPTLTTVIKSEQLAPTFPPAKTGSESANAVTEPQRSDDENAALEEELLHRVLERVALTLENEVSDAVAAALQAQLDVMVPTLRREIESVLRRLVADALARELAAGAGSTLA